MTWRTGELSDGPGGLEPGVFVHLGLDVEDQRQQELDDLKGWTSTNFVITQTVSSGRIVYHGPWTSGSKMKKNLAINGNILVLMNRP
jgi:hypothetical protein